MESQIYREMGMEDRKEWYSLREKKFLHSIDTLYYSVKLKHDFTPTTQDPVALYCRKYFERKLDALEFSSDAVTVNLPGKNSLLLVPVTFSRFYNVCLRRDEYFDIFIATKTPPAGDGSEGSLTPEIVVQIRSYLLWTLGAVKAFEKSYGYVKEICKKFLLEIDYVHENRCDYCWHNNYLQNPEKYFTIENFYKMRVDRFRDAQFHTAKQGSEDFEVDYIRVGRRGSKCFIRIYLKSKEVVEEGYKCWFFKIWLFNGMISRYDYYCYELAYKRKSWKYLDIARMQFYLEYGKNPVTKKKCQEYMASYDKSGKVTDAMRAFVDEITPKITLVLNVEFQTMRKMSKSFPLIEFRDNSSYGPAKELYDYFDNRKLIVDYLTSGIFRLVKTDAHSRDSNKSRRPDNAFWTALRKTRMVDVHVDRHQVSFIREYKTQMNIEMMKNQFINKAVMLGMYYKGSSNTDTPLKDAFDSLMLLNDNDIHSAKKYKKRKALAFNADENKGLVASRDTSRYVLMNLDTGEVLSDDDYNSSSDGNQEQIFEQRKVD